MPAGHPDTVTRIERAETFEADGGWQRLSFLELTASDGTVGWSEFNEAFAAGLGSVVRALAATVIGQDARRAQRIADDLHARGRPVAGGLHAQAAAAVENACLDLKARALGVPVHELFGGARRDEIPAYASHCGLYRIRRPDLFEPRGLRVPHSLDDMRLLAAELRAAGFGALKTNLLAFDAGGSARVHMPGFARSPGHPALHVDAGVVDAAVALVDALRDGAPGAGVMLDLNFNARPEGARRLADALGGRLEWLEVDGLDPQDLAALRERARSPIASLEAVYGAPALLPYLRARAVDVAIVDPMWNGFSESVRMAALADAHHANVASHLFSGALATAMGAHFCAAIPNLRVMEVDADRAPALAGVFEREVEIRAGHARVPDGPGWGVVPDERRLVRTGDSASA